MGGHGRPGKGKEGRSAGSGLALHGKQKSRVRITAVIDEGAGAIAGRADFVAHGVPQVP